MSGGLVLLAGAVPLTGGQGCTPVLHKPETMLRLLITEAIDRMLEMDPPSEPPSEPSSYPSSGPSRGTLSAPPLEKLSGPSPGPLSQPPSRAHPGPPSEDRTISLISSGDALSLLRQNQRRKAARAIRYQNRKRREKKIEADDNGSTNDDDSDEEKFRMTDLVTATVNAQIPCIEKASEPITETCRSNHRIREILTRTHSSCRVVTHPDALNPAGSDRPEFVADQRRLGWCSLGKELRQVADSFRWSEGGGGDGVDSGDGSGGGVKEQRRRQAGPLASILSYHSWLTACNKD